MLQQVAQTRLDPTLQTRVHLEMVGHGAQVPDARPAVRQQRTSRIRVPGAALLEIAQRGQSPIERRQLLLALSQRAYPCLASVAKRCQLGIPCRDGRLEPLQFTTGSPLLL